MHIIIDIMKAKFFPILMNKKAEIDGFNLLTHNFVRFCDLLQPYVEYVTDRSIESLFYFKEIIPIIEDRRTDSQQIQQALAFFRELKKEASVYIPAFRIPESISNEEINLLDGFIEGRHADGLGIAIRINNGQDAVFDYSFFNKLNNRDYIFVDLGESNYKTAMFFLDDIKDKNSLVKVVIISSERRNKKTSKNYCDFGKEPDINSSVLESLRNDSFKEFGFATYCGCRSTINEVGIGIKAFGLILLMNFDDSSFFSIKSPVCSYIGTTYAALKPFILDRKDAVLGLLNENSISRERLETFLENENKGNAQFYIGLSIVHYIEELLYKYYKVV